MHNVRKRLNMSKKMNKGPRDSSDICSIAEFRKRYFPIEDEERANPQDPEEIGAKLAKASLHRLQTALSSLKKKAAA
jgi:hypothetical protein